MVIIRSPDKTAHRRAIGYLVGRFSFKSWATGEIMAPEEALPALAAEGIPYIFDGPARYEHYLPMFRFPAAAPPNGGQS